MALLGRGTIADLGHCGVAATGKGLAKIGRTIPLVRLAGRESQVPWCDEFIMHELAQDVFASEEYAADLNGVGQSSWSRAVDVLVGRGDTPRAALIMEERASEDAVVDWLLKQGDQVLRLGGSSCLMRMVQGLPISRFIHSPGLLLVHARLLQEHGRFDEAIEKANVARAIAEHESDEVLAAAAMLVAGACYSETGSYAAALDLLRDVVARSSADLTHDQRTWATAAMAGCCVCLNRETEALTYASAAESMGRGRGSSESVRSYVLSIAGAIATVVRGDHSAALAHYGRAAESEDVPRALQAKHKATRRCCSASWAGWNDASTLCNGV